MASHFLIYVQAKPPQEEMTKTLKAQSQGGQTKSPGPGMELLQKTSLQISLAEKQFFQDYWENS